MSVAVGLLTATFLAACGGDSVPTPTPTSIGPGQEELRIVASRDASLFEDGDGDLANSVDAKGNFSGKTNNNVLRRALVAFDLSVVSADAQIVAARLEFQVSRSISDNTPMSLHRVLTDWGEGSSDASGEGGRGTSATPGDPTWIHASYDDLFWHTPGGDFEPEASATTIVSRVGGYSWESAGMISDIESWIADPASNNGWMIIGDEDKVRSAKRIDSRENEDPELRPTLVLVIGE